MTSEELRAWRKRLHYSQSGIAKVLGVDVMTISRWERGVRQIPPFLHLALRCVEMEGGEKNRPGTPSKSNMKEEHNG